MLRRLSALLGSAAASGLLLAATPALAQAASCQPPRSIELPRPITPDGPALRTPITGYTLAVSWSPEYCRGKAGGANDYQCGGQIGRFGFVLHGLWPEGRGKPPQWCALTPRPSAEELRANLCMTPVPWLLEHEWAKHGSCMSRTPAGYFKVSSILWDSLKLPDADRLSRQPLLTVGDMRRAFVAANPGFPRASVGVLVSNGGWLRELYLCYGKDFRPAPCPAPQFGPADSAALKIWRGM